MIDQLTILAEAGSSAEGIPAHFVGLGMLIIMLGLLAITYLAGGGNRSEKQDHSAETRTTGHHSTAASDH